MMLPIIENGTFGKFSTSIGLKVYDFLAGVKRSERRSMLNSADTLSREPLLRKEGLKGSGVYVEYRTDDARLTLEVIKEGVKRGVLAVNYTKAEKFIYENGKLVGVQIYDLISGEKKKIYAKKIVNAAGPWVDSLREKDQSKKGKYLHLTKGVHLVIDSSRFPLKEAVYFDTPFNDGRMMFAIPRAGKTYVGTTDTNYKGSITHPRMTTEDREYILKASNFMFPDLNLVPNDVESSWVGLRPLIHEEGKDPSEISRKDEIFLSDSGLITIAGGKLTGYRKMAESVVNLVLTQLSGNSKGYPTCSTDRITLSGGHVGGSAGYQSFIQAKVAEGMKLGLTKVEAEKLVTRYGSNISHLYDVIKKSGHEAKELGLSLEVYASLLYGIQHEMVTTLTDFFSRRTSALLFDIKWVQKWKEPVCKYMSTTLGWSKEEELRHREDLENQIHDAVVPLDHEEQPNVKSV
jgi:glycerol-3-phosphate dehydrogenase